MASLAAPAPVTEVRSAPFIPTRLSKPRDKGRIIEIHGVSLVGVPVSFVVVADLPGIRDVRDAAIPDAYIPMRFVWKTTTESVRLSRVEVIA